MRGDIDRLLQVAHARVHIAGKRQCATKDCAHDQQGGALVIVFGIGLREPRFNGVVGAVLGNCASEVPLDQGLFAEIVVGQPQMHLPRGLVRICRNQGLTQCEHALIFGGCLLEHAA